MVFNDSRFRLVPEISHLDFDENPIDSLLSEAIYRGASDFELERLMRDYERDHMISRGWEIPRLTLDPEFREVKRTNIFNAYKAQVDSEFRGLPEIVRKAFKSRERYLAMRPLYYQRGYSTPFETIFSRIGPGWFLGIEVDQGLHEELAPKLADVERTLNKYSVYSQVANEVKSILGLQLRKIEGSPKLSNHAFGLAIDIDARWNPHIKDQRVIDVLTEITGYNFGTTVDGRGIDKMDTALQEWTKAREASERLKRWLRKYLPIYEANSHTDPQLDPDTARQLERIGILLHFQSTDKKEKDRLEELKRWAEHGVLSIPLALVAAMKINGLRWGGEYEMSKDSMHFELLAKKILPPDSPPRFVQDLLQSPTASAMKAGQKKQRPSHR
jgi:hypothetical protein